MNANAIEIRGLEKHYPGFDLTLDLTLPRGCILGLIGENGAGKSTTIRSVLGMTKPDAGSITVLGRDNRENFADVREEIGAVMDEPPFPACLTPLQVGKVMEGIYRRWEPDTYTGYLKQLAVPEGKEFKDLSRGMKMKLAIAVALSHRARLLILDEPTSGLDPVVRDEVVELFSEFTREEDHAVLISSHIVSDLEKLCDYIAFLHQGRLLLVEEKDRLREQYGLIHCTHEQFRELEPALIVGHRHNPYGEAVIVRREELPRGMTAEPVSIEDLFILMVREEKA